MHYKIKESLFIPLKRINTRIEKVLRLTLPNLSLQNCMDKKRCERCLGNEIYMHYHDTERWVPVHDDRTHFEFLILEWAQAWLSRLTILKRREWYRKAFASFDPIKVSKFDEQKVQKLLLDPGIIRNKLKVRAAVTNAKVFLAIQKEFGSFDAYIRLFSHNKVVKNKRTKLKQCPAASQLSDVISKDLKKRWMRFVWSTIIYAHLQATGIINDHVVSCFRYNAK